MHKFVFNEKSSSEFSTYISGSGTFDAPKRDVTKVKVPGRNGDLTIDNGRYENILVIYPAFIVSEFKKNSDALKAFLLKDSAYHRLEDSYHPEVFRMGKITGPIEFDMKPMNRAGEFSIQFDCKPQRWLKSGEYALQITSGMTLKNPTLYPALPLIRVYGTSGTLYVGNTIVQLKTIDGYVDIDSETQNAYKGTVNCNPNIYAPDFPQLLGETGIRWEGSIDKVEVTPRWWTI